MREPSWKSHSEAEEQNESLKKYEEELAGVRGRIAEYNSRIAADEQEIEKLRKELADRQEKLKIGQTAYHREASRLESLKNITERYDGYGNSIRKVMANRDREKGLIGVVADIIKVDKEYEIAVETALGGNIQNIVTDNEETAKRMIAFLKKNKFGRATFLPLTSMHGSGGIRQQEALREPASSDSPIRLSMWRSVSRDLRTSSWEGPSWWTRSTTGSPLPESTVSRCGW